MSKVVITGGSGLLGPSVVKEFLEHGYEVLNVDRKLPAEPLCRTILTDLTNLGECYSVLAGADAVVHLAAIPADGIMPNEVTYRNNTLSTYNLLEATAGLGIKKAVLSSSESSYGIVFAKKRLAPAYVPMDEDHPQLVQDSYGLTKVVDEQIAAMFHRRTGMQVVSMRFGNIITPAMYARFPGFIRDPRQRVSILWSYIDSRDCASACRLAIEHDGLGSVAINLSADNTSMDVPTREMMAEFYPEVSDFREPLDGYETLLSNRRAKKLLGWKPKYNWRDIVEI